MGMNLLIVDDEKMIINSVREGLLKHKEKFHVDLAYSGEEALEKLKKGQYSLVISDIRMPGMSGLDLMLKIREKWPETHFMAMTAFSNSEVKEQFELLGGLRFIEKPFSFKWFESMLIDFFENKGVTGTVESLELSSILQVINMEQRSLVIWITVSGKKGYIAFEKGDIIDAGFEKLRGLEALSFLLEQNKGVIKFDRKRKPKKRSINVPFMQLIMDVYKAIDEKKVGIIQELPEENERKMEESDMSMREKLEILKTIHGYLGCGVFTPQGEMIEGMTDSSGIHQEVLGSLLNDTLLNAQEMTKQAGFGQADFVQVNSDEGMLFAKCFNDGSKHFHTVLFLKSEGNVAMAKIRLKKVIEELESEF